MKFLIPFIVAFFSFEIYAQSHNSFNGDGTVKTRREIYTYVKNSEANSIAFTAGQVVCHDIAADDGISADYCSAFGEPAYCMVVESCAVGKMCKCLLEGYYSALDFTDADDDAVAGEAVFATTQGNASHKNSPTAGDKVIGTYLDAASASGTVEAYLKF